MRKKIPFINAFGSETVSEFWRKYIPTQHDLANKIYQKLGGQRNPIVSVTVPWVSIELAYDLLFELIHRGDYDHFQWTIYGVIQSVPTILNRMDIKRRAKKHIGSALDDLVEAHGDQDTHILDEFKTLSEESRTELCHLMSDYTRNRKMVIKRIHAETKYGLREALSEQKERIESIPKPLNIAKTWGYVIGGIYLADRISNYLF